MALSSVSSFAANVANRHLQKSNAGFSLALAKMSAGRRVLAAKNDAASLAIGSRPSCGGSIRRTSMPGRAPRCCRSPMAARRTSTIC